MRNDVPDDGVRVVPACRHANQSHSHRAKEAIQESIASLPLGAPVGRIIKLYCGNDPRGTRTAYHEIDVFLSDTVGAAPIPVLLPAHGDVRETDFARNLKAIRNDLLENPKKCSLVSR